jgi:hypothetical protein
MESDTGLFGLSASTMAIVVIVVILVVWGSYTFYYGGVTVPLPSYKTGFANLEPFLGGKFTKGPNRHLPVHHANKDKKHTTKINTTPVAMVNPVAEGFGGVARGAGSPDCLRSSAEGAQLIELFQKYNAHFEEGPDALRELTQLVGKLACFKKDLVSPSYIVEATRYQELSTTHDVEPVAETTGRCFAKTISPRDLSISLDKWNSRGELLVKKLCTTYKVSPQDVEAAQKLFRYVIRDVSDIARSQCLQGDPMIAGKPGPRDAHPYESPSLVEFGSFSGYY